MDIQTTSMDRVRAAVEKMGKGTGQMSNDLEDIKTNQGRIEKNLAETVNALDKCYTEFQDKFGDFKVNSPTEPSSREPQGHPLTPKKLRKILRYDPEQSAKDIKRATAEGHVFSLHDQERAEYLMNSARLKSWLTSPESQFLLINGNAEHSRISPASFACGILASSTLSSKQTLTLSYFCGLHTDSRDEERGAPKLLASLLGQLLSQYDSFDLSFLKSSKQKALKKLPVKLLCKVLAKLLRQLPKGYVALCMIDGISFYEGRGLRDDTRRAIEVLLDLVDDEELGAVVKVVVTSAAMSTEVVKDVAKDAVFNVPVEMDYKNQGFGSRVLGKGAQRQGKGLAHERKGKYQWSMDSSDETDSSDGGSESGSSDEDAAGVHSDTL